MQTNPTLVPGYIDTAELDKDIKTRQQDMQPRFTILRSVYESFDDTMLLMGNDIYNNCIAFYRAVKGSFTG